MTSILLEIPIRTRSLNIKEHWAVKATRVKIQRCAAKLLAQKAIGSKKVREPIVVRLHRLGKGILDDDNLSGSMKAIRDGIADALKRDDKYITWVYSQEKANRYTVLVEILHGS